jgi:Legume lectin domain
MSRSNGSSGSLHTRHSGSARVGSALFLALIGIVLPARWMTGPALASGLSFNYPDFSSVTGLQLNGSAAQVGNVLRLTPPTNWTAGSAFYNTAIDTSQSFHTHFQFWLHDGSSPPADGVSFIIQSDPRGPSAVQPGGAGYIGYVGIVPSLAVEFDIFNNSFESDGNHVAIIKNGDYNNNIALTDPPFTLFGTPTNAWIDYDAATKSLQVFVANGSTKPSTPLLSYTTDLAVDVGSAQAYVGMTGGTGGANATQDILNWQFTGAAGSTPIPPIPPCTGPFALSNGQTEHLPNPLPPDAAQGKEDAVSYQNGHNASQAISNVRANEGKGYYDVGFFGTLGSVGTRDLLDRVWTVDPTTPGDTVTALISGIACGYGTGKLDAWTPGDAPIARGTFTAGFLCAVGFVGPFNSNSNHCPLPSTGGSEVLRAVYLGDLVDSLAGANPIAGNNFVSFMPLGALEFWLFDPFLIGKVSVSSLNAIVGNITDVIPATRLMSDQMPAFQQYGDLRMESLIGQGLFRFIQNFLTDFAAVPNYKVTDLARWNTQILKPDRLLVSTNIESLAQQREVAIFVLEGAEESDPSVAGVLLHPSQAWANQNLLPLSLSDSSSIQRWGKQLGNLYGLAVVSEGNVLFRTASGLSDTKANLLSMVGTFGGAFTGQVSGIIAGALVSALDSWLASKPFNKAVQVADSAIQIGDTMYSSVAIAALCNKANSPVPQNLWTIIQNGPTSTDFPNQTLFNDVNIALNAIGNGMREQILLADLFAGTNLG